MKRKKVSTILVIVLLLAISLLNVFASNTFELQQVFYPIYSNGELVPEDELPILSYNDRTYVPLRKLSEATGLGVYFDDETESISITNQPLYNACFNMAVADTYHNIITLYSTFENFDFVLGEVVSNALEGTEYNDYKMTASFDRVTEYIEKFLPEVMQRMENKINLIAEVGENVPSIDVLLMDLHQRLDDAKMAYDYATKAYEVVDGYIKYRKDDYLMLYFGDYDGFIFLCQDAYYDMVDSAEQQYNYYVGLAVQ